MNVEGLTKSKAKILSNIFKEIDVLTIQETYVPEGETKRLAISGFRMIDFIGHNKHGLATYIDQRLNQQTVQPLEGNEFAIEYA